MKRFASQASQTLLGVGVVAALVGQEPDPGHDEPQDGAAEDGTTPENPGASEAGSDGGDGDTPSAGDAGAGDESTAT